MHILVTNDDGVTAPGLLALAQAMRPLGKVTVVAPDRNWSASGHVKTLHRPLRARPVVLADGSAALASDGAPSDCVALALLGLVTEPPDLVVSGINYGENIASGLMVSGTVGAAIEAATLGMPALAVSLQTPAEFHFNLSSAVDFSVAGYFTRYFAEKMLRKNMPFDVDVIKVDVPDNATPETPWIITRQSRQRYFFPVPREHEDENGSRNMGYITRVDADTPEADSDLRAVILDHVVSVTPLSFDMTSRVDFGELRKLLGE